MHICMLSRSTIFHKEYGGMEHVTHELALKLSESGNQVTLLTTSLKENQKKLVIKNDENYRLLSLPSTKPMKYSNAWWKQSITYFEECNAEKPIDVVLSVSAAGFSLVSQKEKYQIPFVFQAHGTSLGEIQTKLHLNWKKRISSIKNVMGLIKDLKYLPKFDMIIAAGDKTYNTLANSRLKMNNNIILINNAINEKFVRNYEYREELRKKLNIPFDSKVFISTSRLHSEKGIKESLNIFNELQKGIPNVYYLVIGDGPERDALQNQSKSLGLISKVFFLGNINRRELPKFYSCADFLVFPTLRKEVGLPLTVLEALASSLICFVSEDLILTDETPITAINPKDIIGSSKIINETLLKDVVLDKQRMKGVQLIHEQFSIDSWGEKYEYAFRSVMNNRLKGGTYTK